MKARTLPCLLAFAIATAVNVPAAAETVNAGSFADNAQVSYATFFNFSEEPILRSSSTLIRNVNGVSMTLSTSELDPETAYTVWWIIFNDPQHCTMGCDIGDLGNPKVNATGTWAAGGVSDAMGNASFAGHLVKNDDPIGQIIVGNGRLEGDKAEIHLIVRSHGPVEDLTPEQLEAALTEVAGACDVNFCVDQQFAVHIR